MLKTTKKITFTGTSFDKVDDENYTLKGNLTIKGAKQRN
jgi:polyisoprenoid-binding protein YceI